MKTKIGNKFVFEAAHQLNGDIYGKCQNLHGHRYELIVEVEGTIDESGWVCDFAEIERTVKKNVLDRFDHRNMNDFFTTPTVENIAARVFETIDGELKSRPYSISKVVLYETAECYAEITR